jgi:small GTP-binding protein
MNCDPSKPDYTFKIVLVGNDRVGKSNIILQYIYDTFVESLNKTIGVEFHTKNIILNNKMIRLHIWDTSGQKVFNNVTTNIVTGSHGVFIVCDTNNIESYKNIDSWIDIIEDYNHSSIKPVTMVLGNKIDLIEPLYNTSNISNIITTTSKQYFKVSAKYNIDIDKVFEIMVREIMSKYVKENDIITSNYTKLTDNLHNEDEDKCSCCNIM